MSTGSSEHHPHLEEIGGLPRKRKSNFDVPPPAAGTGSESTADTSAAAKIAQAKAIAALLTAYPNTSSLASVTKYIPEGYEDFIAAEGGQQLVQPVYKRDEVYYARLDRAREKNINYVKRLPTLLYCADHYHLLH
mmetsp:Transcript_14224/g.23547  ORF Transcript_14224/g.23547 Transcript_14224/m.23547 type:complete len:135 (+) Transcript_14224:76-480(+)